MSKDLKNKILHAMFWNLLDKTGIVIITFIVSVILARILSPKDFGLIAEVNIFIAVGSILVNSGFGLAIIQKQDITQIDLSSVFILNLAIASALYILLFFTAPLIAFFFNQEILVNLCRFISLCLIFNAMGMVQQSILTRDLDYGTQFRVSAISLLAAGSFGIGLAINGFGVWSLAIQVFCQHFFRNSLMWLFSGWRPNLRFSLTSIKRLSGFSARMLGSGIMEIIFKNVYVVIIGKLFSPADLGFYRRAKTLQEFPVSIISKVLNVVFPSFAQIQDQQELLKKHFKKIMRLTSFFSFPLMILLILIAKPLIRLLLTDKWAPSVPYFQLFCIVGLVYPLSSLILNVLLIRGRADTFFKIELIKRSLLLISIAPSLHWGIKGLIAGYASTSIICHFINAHFAGREINYSLKEQLVDIIPIGSLSAIMIIPVYHLSKISTNPLLLVIIQSLSAILIFLSCATIFRFKEIKEIKQIVFDKLKSDARL